MAGQTGFFDRAARDTALSALEERPAAARRALYRPQAQAETARRPAQDDLHRVA